MNIKLSIINWFAHASEKCLSDAFSVREKTVKAVAFQLLSQKDHVLLCHSQTFILLPTLIMVTYHQISAGNCGLHFLSLATI